MMKFVVLDAYSINPGDLAWDALEKVCALETFDRTEPEEMVAHIGDSDGLFVSKCNVTREILAQCPNLKFIGVTATGYDNVDIQAAKELGIAVCNVPAYSTEAVAQHVFALLLELTNHVGQYHASVQRGRWYESKDFTFLEEPLTLLDGKSLGIVGYGNIGKRVARIGEALGMKIHIYSRDPKAAQTADYLTLHCPLTTENQRFVNAEFIRGMKDGAVLINTARGGLIDDEAVAQALTSGKLAAAAIDVLAQEPPVKPHPLIGLPNCILTPHIAWMPKETRQKVIDICADNLTSWFNEGSLNRIV